MVVEAYSPLAKGVVQSENALVDLAAKYCCSWAQLMIKWSLQRGLVPLPKSGQRENIKANANVGFFDIADDDMKKLTSLNTGLCVDWDLRDAD